MNDWKHKPSLDHDLTLTDSLNSIKRESGLIGRFSSAAWWTLMKLYMRIGHRLEVIGAENLPTEGPFVIVANHSSHLDVIALAAALPARLRTNVLPIAAGDTFFTSKAKSWFSAIALNALPLWRRSGTAHSLTVLRERLAETESIVILFPEGTRSRDGQMASFKPGIGMILAGVSAPAVPCHLKGTHAAFPSSATRPKFTKICLIIGEPVRYQTLSNSRESWEHIANDLERRVAELGTKGVDQGK